MYLFLVPLILGFTCNLASAFTATFSHWWGVRSGSIVTVILRDVLGIPIWVIGLALAIHTPSPIFFISGVVTDIAGWCIIAAGCVIIFMALAAIQWRAAMPSARDMLVHTGIYARVRHPIHSGTLLEFIGLFFLMPRQTVAMACILGIVWVLVQTKFEEADLLQRMPAYRAYMDRVPCFLPRFGKK
jgi:protein-S-isoprenylcysteine O-methyltransferase Ste14